MKYDKEINRRKTFAIISHPDAGKTTLTEKLLLFGGAIQVAGAVKSNKIKKFATSDFMEIERQRGISVATSVMSFEYKNILINLLDTPGHKDFAEDTYRTLTAVDSVILVIDSVNGVEEQTRKLVEVCRMRDTPIIVFVNKLDRDGKFPFDLLDEIEKELKLSLHPLSWPINMGKEFKGVYNLHDSKLNLFTASQKSTEENTVPINDLNDTLLDEKVDERDANLDPRHRDRIAFLRVCSGRFARNTYYKHTRLSKDVRFSNPYSFMAREKDVIEEAYPGDVVGLFDTGTFKIGDTLTEGEVMQF